MQRVQRLEIKGEALLVVCTTPFEEDYVVDLIVEPEARFYLLNNMYMNDLSVVDVDILEDFALISSYDSFYIIRHSISRIFSSSTMHHST